jgi:hypothetical protein
LSFDPCNHSLKIWESIWDSNSQDESSIGNVRVHSFTLFWTLGNMKCDSHASLLARTLASFCFGHEPKARVMTCTHIKSYTPMILKNDYMSCKDYNLMKSFQNVYIFMNFHYNKFCAISICFISHKVYNEEWIVQYMV